MKSTKQALSKLKALMTSLKKGDRVTWTSQAGKGYEKKKLGPIVGSVKPGKFPNQRYGKARFSNAEYERIVSGLGRNHRSFVIRDEKTGKLYWPLVKNLRAVR